MKHLRKNLTSLAVALVMTAALCAAVIFTGQTSAVAETGSNVVRSGTPEVQTGDLEIADASGILAGANLRSTLPAAHAVLEAPPMPSALGPLAGAMNAPEAPEEKQEDSEKAEKAEATKADSQPEDTATAAATPPKAETPAATTQPAPALPASDTSVIYVGTVSSSGVRVRTAPVSGSIITNLNAGTVVSIYGLQDGWYKVGYDGKTGYMSADYVTARTSASDLSGYGRVTADALNLRTGPGSGYGAIQTVSSGQYVSLTGFENGWYAVSYNGTSGYMSGDWLSPVATKPAPAPTPAPTPTPTPSEPEPTPEPDPEPAPGSGNGSSIVDYAVQFIGTPYVYGGASPSGFDCSGFTMYVFQHFGYSLPHGATGQLRYGTAVSKSDLQPGDLVFFYDPAYGGSGITATHVGIYAGNRQFLHASSYYGGVCYSSIDDPYYYSPYFVGARRMG